MVNTETKFRLVATRTEAGVRSGAPEYPPAFRQIEGDYRKVSKIAVRMNEAQAQHSRRDYTFSPEPLRGERHD